ncbi:MAG: hypothetical protein KKD08_10685 [Alphaproteobacteria bacterium]|jgi:hypothetical protein|nr:hypothetical protein [Alphaproteobacteria bacterium]
MKKLFIPAGLGLAALGSLALAATPAASGWVIGPIIKGKNYSVGMPLHPSPMRNGWYFEFPYPDRDSGHVHYVTFQPESLAGKSRIRVRYRVNAAPSTRFIPQEHVGLPATVSLFFQRRGDTWTARGKYNYFRWYAPGHSVQEIGPGTYQMTVRLDDPQWTPVMGGEAMDHQQSFRTALADPVQIGLVFGSRAARGHGVFTTAPARFELLSFDIE